MPVYCIYQMKYYSSLEKNEATKFKESWQTQNVKLSEITQYQGKKIHVLSCMWILAYDVCMYTVIKYAEVQYNIEEGDHEILKRQNIS